MPQLDLSLPITDPVLIFGVVMLIVLGAPLLFARLRVPGLVGLILAGALVGPSALGLLERDATMVLLGTVGLLYLMFTAGLSIDLHQFSRVRQRSLVFGLLSFFFPQVLAFGVGTMLLGYSTSTALLLGSIVGSHTLVAYPIAARLGITKNTAVTMAMGGTLVTDAISLALLAVVAAFARGAAGPLFWIQFVGLVGLYVGAVLWGLPRLGQWFFRSIRGQPNIEFVFLLAVVLLTAYLAGVVGLAPIIGAFLAGLALNRLVPESSTLMSRITFVGDALFIPFFLVSVGMLVDFGVLFRDVAVWGLALAFTALVVVGKSAAAKLTERIYGYAPEEGWTVAGLSIPQAAATLAVTIIGFELGLFTEVAVNAVVVMILLTCLLGSGLVETYGRRVALEEERKPFEPNEAPQRILVPLANPESAPLLLDLALLLRAPTSEEPLFPLTVARDGASVEASVVASEKLLGHAVVHAAAAGVPVVPLTRVDYNVARGIVRAIKERRISTIVIGWGGESSARAFVFGSVLDQLLRENGEMMLLSKIEQPLATTQRVVLAIPPYADREPGFSRVLRAVKLMTSQLGARLLLVAAEEHLPTVRDWADETRPSVPVDVHPLGTWAGLLAALGSLVGPNDLLVLLNVREGTLAWRPTLNRLPRLLAQRHPQTSLIVLYPPESVEMAAFPARPMAARLMAVLSPQRVTTNLTGDSTRAVLRAMLHDAFDDTPPALDAVLAALLRMEPDYIPELLPGVVFYHAHLDRVPQPLLFVGISPDGLNLPMTAGLVHVVLVLLSPMGEPPERHLARLAEVARVFRTPDLVDQLRAATHPEEVLPLFADRTRPPESTEATGGR